MTSISTTQLNLFLYSLIKKLANIMILDIIRSKEQTLQKSISNTYPCEDPYCYYNGIF